MSAHRCPCDRGFHEPFRPHRPASARAAKPAPERTRDDGNAAEFLSPFEFAFSTYAGTGPEELST